MTNGEPAKMYIVFGVGTLKYCKTGILITILTNDLFLYDSAWFESILVWWFSHLNDYKLKLQEILQLSHTVIVMQQIKLTHGVYGLDVCYMCTMYVYQSWLDRVQIMSNAMEGTYQFMTMPHRAINSVESKNTPLVQKHLGWGEEYFLLVLSIFGLVEYFLILLNLYHSLALSYF